MRRGEIALSTNAIVTVVIALVVLVLLIVFVTGGFGSVSALFMGTAKESISPKASSADNLEYAFDNPPLQGEQFLLRVSVFNDGPAAPNVGLKLSCPPGIILGGLRSSPKNIAARETAQYQALGDIDFSAPPSSHICTLSAESATGRTLASTDIVLSLG